MTSIRSFLQLILILLGDDVIPPTVDDVIDPGELVAAENREELPGRRHRNRKLNRCDRGRRRGRLLRPGRKPPSDNSTKLFFGTREETK